MPLFFSSDINVVDTIENATRKKNNHKNLLALFEFEKKKKKCFQ